MARNSKRNVREPSHAEIACRAQEIFQETGAQPGRDVENWLIAEAQIRTALAMEAENTTKKQAKPANAVAAFSKPTV